MADHTRTDERDADSAEDDAGPGAGDTDTDTAAQDEGAPEDATTDGPDDGTTDDGTTTEGSGGTAEAGLRRGRRRRRGAEDVADDGGEAAAAEPEPPAAATRPRASLPLVPVLAVLLVLLLAGTGYLLATRPAGSSVRTDDYVDALQAARAGIVDVASFDYVTLDDDIQQIRSVTTGDLQTESVDQLDGRRQEITEAQAVVNTEVVGAAVGAADEDSATVYMVIQSTQSSSASTQAQVQRYRIQVDLTKDGDRWLLSGITGR